MIKFRYQVQDSFQTAIFSRDIYETIHMKSQSTPHSAHRFVPLPKQSDRICSAAILSTWAYRLLRLYRSPLSPAFTECWPVWPLRGLCARLRVAKWIKWDFLLFMALCEGTDRAEQTDTHAPMQRAIAGVECSTQNTCDPGRGKRQSWEEILLT